MPRATFKKDRLYTSEITTLQRLLKFTNVDERITVKNRQHLSACVAFIVTTLSNAQSPKLDGEI